MILARKTEKLAILPQFDDENLNCLGVIVSVHPPKPSYQLIRALRRQSMAKYIYSTSHFLEIEMTHFPYIKGL